MIGESVAGFLAELIPEGIYDHLLAHKLRDFGIVYDQHTHVLAYGGVIADLPTYTPAEMLALEPQGWLNDVADRYVRAIDLARALHYLLWPLETPPSRETTDPIEQYDADMASISERGNESYREGRPMWRPELAR